MYGLNGKIVRRFGGLMNKSEKQVYWATSLRNREVFPGPGFFLQPGSRFSNATNKERGEANYLFTLCLNLKQKNPKTS
jgi:hypothetical protein